MGSGVRVRILYFVTFWFVYLSLYNCFLVFLFNGGGRLLGLDVTESQVKKLTEFNKWVCAARVPGSHLIHIGQKRSGRERKAIIRISAHRSICFQFCNRFVLSFNKILTNYSHWCLVDILEGQKHMGFWLNCVVVIMYFLRHRQCFNPAAKCLNISTSHGEASSQSSAMR